VRDLSGPLHVEHIDYTAMIKHKSLVYPTVRSSDDCFILTRETNDTYIAIIAIFDTIGQIFDKSLHKIVQDLQKELKSIIAKGFEKTLEVLTEEIKNILVQYNEDIINARKPNQKEPYGMCVLLCIVSNGKMHSSSQISHSTYNGRDP